MDAIFNRRSVRKYTDTPVSEEDLSELLRAAMRAPSAGNEQPWHFVVLRKRETMLKITEVTPYAGMLKEAPCCVVVCGDLTLEKHNGYWVQDCSAATQNLLLEAVHLGLGAVWLGLYPVEERVEGIRRLLDLPEHILPLGAVAIGHPAEPPKPIDTYKPERVHQETW